MVALFVLVTIVVLLAIEMVVGKLEGRRFVVAAPAPASRGFFAAVHVPERTFFHRGHAWARVESDGIVTVGVDGFTRTMAGQPDEITAPEVGARLSQGRKGWTLRRGSRNIPMLAPVDGEVIARNDAALAKPTGIATDPYEDGWLLKVKPTDLRANLANLFDGNLARRWMEESYERLSRFFSPELGAVMQDGGVLAEGIIEAVEPERVPELVREFFLAESETVSQ